MPPPPPPPPAPGPPKRPPQPSAAKKVGNGGALDRGALLSSIEKGARLKKTVTNDRSAPLVSGKTSSSTLPASNGPLQGSSSGVSMVNGGAPQLGGLFAGGMPKLRPTGRVMTDITDSGPTSARMHLSGGGLGSPMIPIGKKPVAAPTYPGSVKPSLSSSHSSLNSVGDSHSHSSASSSNGYLPPSPKPSSKSNPAPPPPPSFRKPSVPDKGPGSRPPHLEVPPPTSKPIYSKPHLDSQSSHSEERQPNPPLPAKPPSFRVRPDLPGPRGAPPRPPPSSSKPAPPPKSPDIKPDIELRRPSIDRSVSLREPNRPYLNPPVRVGTSAESPAAPFRVHTNHREAPPVPASRPQLSKTVGRAAGARLMPGLRPPTVRPPKPPQRPVVAAPPPPSQPPPPPPAHRAASATTNITPGPKADVPLPPIPHSTGPPPPPERNESTRTTSNIKQVGDFESKFSSFFKNRTQFPLPLTYSNVQKIYPSKNNGKSQRRAPLPPTSAQQQQQQQQKQEQHYQSRGPAPIPSSFSTSPSNPKKGPHSTGVSYPSFSSYNNNNPPPPPPHAPLHLQMDRKFYSTEASHC